MYRDPAPPRRRKRRSPEDVLLARLKRYEQLLENAGVKVDRIGGANTNAVDDEHLDESGSRRTSMADNAGHNEPDEPIARQNPLSDDLPPTRAGGKSANSGRFVVEEGRSRYLEK